MYSNGSVFTFREVYLTTSKFYIYYHASMFTSMKKVKTNISWKQVDICGNFDECKAYLLPPIEVKPLSSFGASFRFEEGLRPLDRPSVVPRCAPHGFTSKFEIGPLFGNRDGST